MGIDWNTDHSRAMLTIKVRKNRIMSMIARRLAPFRMGVQQNGLQTILKLFQKLT